MAVTAARTHSCGSSVGIVILSVVALFLPLGPNRLWVSLAIVIAGFVTHAIQKWVPDRNIDGATHYSSLRRIST